MYRELDTDRLRLRRPEGADAEPLFRTVESDPEVTRFLAWQPHLEISDSEKALALRLERIAAHVEYSWIIEPIGRYMPIGLISAWFGENDAELGFMLSRSHWGAGLMTEAVIAVKDWAFGEAALTAVWATCDTENLASARVLEKADFLLKGPFHRKVVRPNLSTEPRTSLFFEARLADQRGSQRSFSPGAHAT